MPQVKIFSLSVHSSLKKLVYLLLLTAPISFHLCQTLVTFKLNLNVKAM